MLKQQLGQVSKEAEKADKVAEWTKIDAELKDIRHDSEMAILKMQSRKTRPA